MANPTLPDIDVSPVAFDTEHADALVTQKTNRDSRGLPIGDLPTSVIPQKYTAELGNLQDGLLRQFQRRLAEFPNVQTLKALGTDDGIVAGMKVRIAATGSQWICHASGLTTSTSTWRPAKGVVHAADYGVVADGVTDDSAAMAACIADSYGYKLKLPRGEIRIASGPLVIDPHPSASQLPFRMIGEGFDGNGGSGGTFFSIEGATNGIEIVNPTGSLNNLVELAGFGVYGDGADASGGIGILAQQVAGLVLRDLWVGDMRGTGVKLIKCWGAVVDGCVIHRNRIYGLWVDSEFNNGQLRRSKVMSNGRIYSQIGGNIRFDSATGNESLGPTISDCDWSYAGGSPFLGFSTATNIVDIVVSSNVATATTSVAHGLSTNDTFCINGATTAAFDSVYAYTVTSTPTSTSFTFATSGVGDGTYDSASDPGLAINPAAFGMNLSELHGAKIISAYSEDCSWVGMYWAGNNVSVSVDGGYMQGHWVLVDSASKCKIDGIRFTLGQRSLSQNAGMYNGITDMDVGTRNSFATNAKTVLPTVYLRDGQYYSNAAPAAGTWAQGDRVWNTAPAAAGTPGWVCVTAGTPGTWKAMANVAA